MMSKNRIPLMRDENGGIIYIEPLKINKIRVIGRTGMGMTCITYRIISRML